MVYIGLKKNNSQEKLYIKKGRETNLNLQGKKGISHISKWKRNLN